MTNRPLRVFLCHSSNDKPAVRELYQKLRAEPWIEPWLDEEKIYPGDDWNFEIEKAVEAADMILVCLSQGSITKEGYVQREIRIALDYADFKPEGTLFIIPIRLEDCKPPKRLMRWQYEDYFHDKRERGLQRLLVSLQRRADSLGLKYEPVGRVSNPTSKVEEKPVSTPKKDVPKKNVEKQASHASSVTYETQNKIILSNGMELMRVPAGKFLMGSTKENKNAFDDEKPQHTVDIPYDYWMARFPVTNDLYNAYIKSKNTKHPVSNWEKKKDHPITYVKWTDAMEYCKWLNQLLKAELPSGLILRLPTEAEWEKASRGTDGREYPWGNEFDKNKCNSSEAGKGDTTPVGLYSPQGDSPYGCADMSGNVWEWTHSLFKEYPYNVKDMREDENASGRRVLRGGSFDSSVRYARCASRLDFISYFSHLVGFRVCASPNLS